MNDLAGTRPERDPDLRTPLEGDQVARTSDVVARLQITGLIEQLPIAVAADCITALIWGLLLMHQSPDSKSALAGWLALLLAAQLPACLLQVRHLSNDIRTLQRSNGLHWIVFATVSRSLAWVVGVAFVMPGDPLIQICTAVLVIALLSTSLRTLGSSFSLLMTYSLPIAAVLVARLMLSDDFDRVLVALMGVGTFLLALLTTASWLSERSRATLAIERRNVELLGRLRDETTALEKSMERTQRALEFARQAGIDKTRFLAAASHDLRQPVHAIGLFVAALKAEAFQGRSRYLVDRLDRSLAGLDELFNRLLDISRLDSGVIVPAARSFPLQPIAQTLESRFAQLSTMKNLRFRVHCPADLYVRSDSTLLAEMIMNLLSNAFRYTESGGVLLAFRARKGSVLIQIWDTGSGIVEGDLKSIFEEFVQLDNPSRDRRKGLGLGLAIVKRIGALLEVPITVRSTPSRGSMFELSVVRDLQPAVPADIAGENLPTPRDIRGTLVFVVDDEIDILAAMEALLNAWGCYAILARTIEEAIKYVEASPRFPDVVATDHRLTDHTTSFDVIESLQAVLPAPIPVIVISGEPGTSLERRIVERGWQYMSKPVSADGLRGALEKSLGEAAEV